MLKLTMMLLTILWVSACRSPNTQIVCSQLETHKIKNIKSCDISFRFNRCRCRCFNMNAWKEQPLKDCKEFSGVVPEEVRKFKKKTGEVYEAVNYPADHCEGISGFYLDTIATEVRPNVKALNQIKENLCQ